VQSHASEFWVLFEWVESGPAMEERR